VRSASALLTTVLAGALLATQSHINGDLSGAVGSHHRGAPVVAAAISFTVGTVALLGYTAATGALRDARAQLRQTPGRWWYRIGGLGGAALVATSAAAVPQVGVALTSVFVVTGQTAGSLGVDGVGLGPGGRHAHTTPRLIGAGLAVVALVVGAVGAPGGGLALLLLLAVVVAGALVAGQQAVNGRLGQAAGSPAYAALVSFAGGTALLVVGALVLGVAGGLPHLRLSGPVWLYLGGLGGAVYITLCARVVGALGVLRVSLGSVTGQLAGGLVFDLVAPAAGTHVRVATYAAVALTLAALVVSGARARA
jgi:transporter family-2 protein